MSLINDAIKRANQTVSQRQTPVDGIRLRPVESQQGPNLRPLIVIACLLIALLAAGGWLLRKGLPWGKKDTTVTQTLAKTNPPPNATAASQRSSTSPTATTSPPSSPAIKPKPGGTASTASSPPTPSATEAAQPPALAPKPKPNTTTQPPVVAIAPLPMLESKPPAKTPPPSVSSSSPATPSGPPPEFPVLKLQGIYYRRVNPSALINGETVRVGDLVKGVKVVSIERSAVTLELNGFKKVITFQ